eukprot:TRINITY_DN41367_c0_g1_i1.p1 TRINITY_DN41367_c0_g1~~TRINITY_DN41367_c0_g1_i1.p1  ORF type:complete len:216 (+),score=67.80 TRINITY_DN41367_c0_g1_i1:91-738(+)
MAEEDDNVDEYVYKILVVGDLGSGKTSLIHRYVNGTFSSTYRATIGVDFALKTLRWEDRLNIRLQLWDIAGQERFGHMTRVYYKEAVGAMIVYDVTREKTFQAVTKWKADIDENLSDIPVLLLANKCDLIDKDQDLDKEMLDRFCKENGFIGWFSTSAKDDVNVDEAGDFLVKNILMRDPKAQKNSQDKPTGVVDLKGGAQSNTSSEKTDKGCAC